MLASAANLAPPPVPMVELGLPTPGAIWRRALTILCARLEADGLAPDRAEELGESAIIACALQHVPVSVDEAFELALRAIAR